jgi:hypothetical protein
MLIALRAIRGRGCPGYAEGGRYPCFDFALNPRACNLKPETRHPKPKTYN